MNKLPKVDNDLIAYEEKGFEDIKPAKPSKIPGTNLYGDVSVDMYYMVTGIICIVIGVLDLLGEGG